MISIIRINKWNLLITFLAVVIGISCTPSPYLNGNIVHSEKSIIDDSLNLKKGFYKTYGEFKTNSPSIPMECEIQSGIFPYFAGTSIIAAIAAAANQDTFYTLKIEKAKTKEIGTVWGFCDGKNVYINREFSIWSGKTIFNPDSKFYKILFIGRYCYFISAIRSVDGFYHFNCAIDFNTGELIEINKSKVKDIISKDAELIQKFNNEGFWDKYSDLIYGKYLKLYSEKHKDEIIK